MNMVRVSGAHAVRATEAALLCEVDGEEVWIPKSQIGEFSCVSSNGDFGTLEIPKWLAEEKGLDWVTEWEES